jgi:hypothetical protein
MGRPRSLKEQCSESGCPRDAWARGRCGKHYQQLRKKPGFKPTKPISLIERFWRDVDTRGGPDACWPWLGCVHPSGYGTIYVHDGSPKLQKAHRFSYELHHGPIPDGLEVDHTCHTKACPTPGWGDHHRRCCNPAHLEAVTRAVNVQRSQAPELTHEYMLEMITCCPQGHPYDEANTQWRIIKGGYRTRRCAECNRAGVRAWKAAKRGAA